MREKSSCMSLALVTWRSERTLIQYVHHVCMAIYAQRWDRSRHSPAYFRFFFMLWNHLIKTGLGIVNISILHFSHGWSRWFQSFVEHGAKYMEIAFQSSQPGRIAVKMEITQGKPHVAWHRKQSSVADTRKSQRCHTVRMTGMTSSRTKPVYNPTDRLECCNSTS